MEIIDVKDGRVYTVEHELRTNFLILISTDRAIVESIHMFNVKLAHDRYMVVPERKN